MAHHSIWQAVEYFIKDQFDALGLGAHKEFIHFGLTSQDVNNTAVPLAMRAALHEVRTQTPLRVDGAPPGTCSMRVSHRATSTQVYLPTLRKFVTDLKRCAKDWDQQPMLARTHGQAATPTRLGKEMMVFVERIENQIQLLEGIPVGCKLGGATGVMAAHYVAFPDVKWDQVFNQLCARLGMTRQQYTTQIEHYDNLGATCVNMARINTILIDYCRDMWMYVSLGYFTQTVIKTEVGSSAMPHKVNPIDFENGEGNFGLANATFGHLSAKLPISRLQRDLSDSTVIRNIGGSICPGRNHTREASAKA
jgi:adenylosuccinate lyase